MLKTLWRRLEIYKSPLTRKVTIGVFLGIILIEIIILVPSYNNKEKELLNGLTSKIDLIATSILPISELSLEHRLGLLREVPDIIHLYDADALDEEQMEIYSRSSHTLTLSHNLPDDKDRRVVIIADAAFVPVEMNAYVGRIVGLILIISAFVTVVTMLVLERLLINPLMKLNTALNSNKDDVNIEALSDDMLDRRDELGDLARSYKSLGDNISAAFSEIEVLARFPYENPNPILRCSSDFKIMYSNTIAWNETGFFKDSEKSIICDDLKYSVKHTLDENQNATQTINCNGTIYSCTLVPIKEYGYCNLYARDITSQIRAEKALQSLNLQLEDVVRDRTRELEKQKSQLSATISASLDAIIIMSLDGRIVEFSQSAESVFGYKTSEVMGKILSDYLIPEQFKESHDKGLLHFIETGEGNVIGKRIEIEAQHKDGHVFPIELAIHVSGSGEERLFIAYLRDISSRKEQEQDLILAKEHAESANTAKSEFLATMSHEIRTPMNGVIGMTGLLMDTGLNDEQHHYADTIRHSGEALMRIINDILDYTKIEVGKLELEESDFDMVQLCESVVDLLASKAMEKGLQFGSLVSPEINGTYKSDPGRIRQILLNFITNAIKFTTEGAVILRVEDTGQGIRFEVEDNGIGISEEDADKLFQKFTQVDASTTRKYGGTGLGLAISKLIVEALGGEIGLTSELGKGSTFWFTLPLERLEASPLLAQDEKSVLENKQALIIDDNQVNREIFDINMSSWGMKTTLCSSVKEALKQSDAHDFDIIMLDFNMPDQNGSDFLKEYQQKNKEKTVPVVLATSSNEVSEEIKPHIEQFILKPIRQQALKNVLLSCLCEKTKEALQSHSTPVQDKPLVRTQEQLRILVAEDNQVNQMVAQGILKKLGHYVDVASNGLEAINAVENLPYDMVLMDIQMPECDGYQATREIRARSASYANIPIVAMTANAMSGDREKCLLAGMNDYLSKPVTADKLSSCIEQLLGRFNETSDIPTEESHHEPEIRHGSTKLWNEETVETMISDLDLDGYQMLLRTYLKNTLTRLENISAAMDDNDNARLKKEAHSLKGASNSIGAKEIADMAVRLEQQVEDDIPNAEQLNAAFETFKAEATKRFLSEA
ncbi:putative Histidine kinase [Candidatus Terasakiella magnetica]|uniref:Sensory/regulatory protein RpfC n=1 Tax=Candidatus Terasakiella magnetica TaxID=1867952 RepID=A0A1C3RJX1_9PROT|nr:response regulator [Candidatus Terasakiella magnetica]SCA57584.1 putative Histidine kinase [Candidatus Terasakiella magnetica]